MTGISQDLSPILLGAIVAAVAWFVRMQANWQAAKRTRQLAQAAEFLDAHAMALGDFLDDPAAPKRLKRLLIEFSDAMASQDVALKMVEWAIARPLDQQLDTEATRAVENELAPLRGSRADLVDVFDAAILTAVAGATLRWSESAAMFERAFPRLAAARSRDAAIAATATSFRASIPFSVKSPAAAMA
jgi:hypothetical protein